MESIEDSIVLNKIKHLQSNLQNYPNKQLDELLDALEEFNAYRPDTVNKVLDVAARIEIESK